MTRKHVREIHRGVQTCQYLRASTATQKYRNMKARLRTHGGVATLAKAASLRRGLRLPWARSHHFHYVSLLPGYSTRLKTCPNVDEMNA